MLGRVLFYPSLGINAVMTSVTSRSWYDRLDETVILGALPVKSITRKLIAKENVRAMVSVNEDFELKHLMYTQEELTTMGLSRLQLRTPDYIGTPTQEHIAQAIKFILEYRKLGSSVYVHCKAGRTRSATVAACYLIQINSWRPEQAIHFLKSKRPQVWLHEKQLNSIQLFYQASLRS